MNKSALKAQIRGLVFGIFGLIVAVVVIRIILKLVGANEASPLVSFWYNFTDFFIAMFRNTYPQLQSALLQIRIELYAVMALLFYMLLAFLVQKSFVSFTEPDAVEVTKGIIDSMFKIAEFLLIMRFFFKLTGASLAGQFVVFIYSISALVYEPFRGILPTINVGDTGIVLESSTLIAIIIVVIFDLVLEGIIDNMTKHRKTSSGMNANYPVAMPQQQIMPAPIHQPAQNITINMPHPQPMQQMPPQVIDRRTVQVIHPQVGQYPYYGQNDLNHQNPQQQLPGYPQNYPQPNRNPNNPGSRVDHQGRREA